MPLLRSSSVLLLLLFTGCIRLGDAFNGAPVEDGYTSKDGTVGFVKDSSDLPTPVSNAIRDGRDVWQLSGYKADHQEGDDGVLLYIILNDGVLELLVPVERQSKGEGKITYGPENVPDRDVYAWRTEQPNHKNEGSSGSLRLEWAWTFSKDDNNWTLTKHERVEVKPSITTTETTINITMDDDVGEGFWRMTRKKHTKYRGSLARFPDKTETESEEGAFWLVPRTSTVARTSPLENSVARVEKNTRDEVTTARKDKLSGATSDKDSSEASDNAGSPTPATETVGREELERTGDEPQPRVPAAPDSEPAPEFKRKPIHDVAHYDHKNWSNTRWIYTDASEAEKITATDHWKSRGVLGFGAAKKEDDSVPLWRFLDSKTSRQQYFLNEPANKKQHKEALLAWVWTEPKPDMIKVFVVQDNLGNVQITNKIEQRNRLVKEFDWRERFTFYLYPPTPK